jgi:hypothetical protein
MVHCDATEGRRPPGRRIHLGQFFGQRARALLVEGAVRAVRQWSRFMTAPCSVVIPHPRVNRIGGGEGQVSSRTEEIAMSMALIRSKSPIRRVT